MTMVSTVWRRDLKCLITMNITSKNNTVGREPRSSCPNTLLLVPGQTLSAKASGNAPPEKEIRRTELRSVNHCPRVHNYRGTWKLWRSEATATLDMFYSYQYVFVELLIFSICAPSSSLIQSAVEHSEKNT